MSSSTSPAYPDAAATWDKRFQGDDYLFGTAPNDYLREHASRFAPAGRVLCVADGEGRNSVWLARQGHRVDAFDISAVGVAKALKLAADAGVEVDFSVASVDDWTWPEQRYDAVVAVFVQFADPAMRERLFANMVRALQPGGVLLLQGYTPKQLDYRTGGPPEAAHMYTEALLKSEFAALQIDELREYEAELSEGRQHSGRSALIGMVARKR